MLIVEDDGVLAESMAAHLREAGHESVQVGDGRKALSRLRYERPDVCVLDLMLPEVDGWHVIDAARREGIGTPIVVVSARGTEHDRIHALDIGADDYLVEELRLDPANVQAYLDGDSAELTPAEFRLLYALATGRWMCTCASCGTRSTGARRRTPSSTRATASATSSRLSRRSVRRSRARSPVPR